MGRVREMPKLPSIQELEPEGEAVLVEIQFASPRGGHVAERVELSRMTRTQVRGLHFLVSSLDRTGATLQNGARVTTAVDAIRWVAEQLAEPLPINWKPPGF